MTNSAEFPLLGPDAKKGMAERSTAAEKTPVLAGDAVPDCDKTDNITTREPDVDTLERQLPPLRFRQRSPGNFDDELDDEDAPMIRRMTPDHPVMHTRRHEHGPGRSPQLCTPRLFAAQIPAGLPEEFKPDMPATRDYHFDRPPEWYEGRSDSWSGSDNADFSVAAIRARRMRTPAGTHHASSMATKVTVMSLASVCLIAAGVSLGLYGGDLRYHVEDRVAATGSAIQDAYVRLTSAAPGGFDAGNGSLQASMAGGSGGSAAALLGPDAREGAPADGGRKLIYKRLPIENADASDALAPPVEASRTAQAGSTLDALLATPVDFNALPGVQTD